MLQSNYKTNLRRRCKRLCFGIPLSSLALFFAIGICMIGSSNDEMVYAVNGETMFADTPSASLSIGKNSAGSNTEFSSIGTSDQVIEIGVDVSVQANLIDGYNLQISGTPTLEGKTPINAITTETSELTNNTWGYRWDNGDIYKGISTINTTIDNSGVDGNGSVNYTKPLTFAVKFDDDAEAGHYKTKVNLSLTATPKALITYTLSYDANGGSNTPNSQNCSTYLGSCNITIGNATPTSPDTNLIFSGWADTPTASNKQYDIGGNITMSSNKTIYAIWKDGRTMGQITNLQDMNSDICSNSPIGTAFSLKDSRDGNSYTVQRLVDGKCWMTQNLRLTGKRTLTPSDSDVLVNYSLPASSISGFSNNTAQNMYYGNDQVFGAYYSWCAATANTCSQLVNGYAPSSICPKGWKLPISAEDFNGINTGGNWIGESGKVGHKLGGAFWPAAGFYMNSAAQDVNFGGYYHSRTGGTSNDTTHYLYFASGGIYTAQLSGRATGFPMRCIAQ